MSYHGLIPATEGALIFLQDFLKYSDQDKHLPKWRQGLTIGICIDQVATLGVVCFQYFLILMAVCPIV